MSSRKFWWLLVISWCILIFLLTALPAFTAPHTGVVLKHATDMPITQVNFANLILRKSTHVTLFGILAMLLYKATGLNVRMAWILATLYGASDELHQLFVPGRGSALKDVAFDSFGVFLVLGIVILIKRRNSIHYARHNPSHPVGIVSGSVPKTILTQFTRTIKLA